MTTETYPFANRPLTEAPSDLTLRELAATKASDAVQNGFRDSHFRIRNDLQIAALSLFAAEKDAAHHLPGLAEPLAQLRARIGELIEQADHAPFGFREGDRVQHAVYGSRGTVHVYPDVQGEPGDLLDDDQPVGEIRWDNGGTSYLDADAPHLSQVPNL